MARFLFFALLLLPVLALASPQTVATSPSADATARADATQALADAATALAFAETVYNVQLTADPEVDPGSTRNVGIQVQDRNGDNVAFNVDLVCEVRSQSTSLLELTADFTLEEIATGLPLYPSAGPWQSTAIIRTSATGAATMQVAEIAVGAEGAKSVILVCGVLGTPGGVSYTALSFDADDV